ncbi:hypothetical protein I546_1069 [Mycobacterium kansasii 732]|uniref:Uncharacterized protein n=1 Tax=Mycobacterium pseudokansasii TaxID=2341080 RepID=A0A498QJH8_9MYCO|nr:hypothetical protein I546_1069 [Mycobacterium kansasii 732]VBA46900.1 hypothetical protein LAUMK142_00518 [Mycobacterium pseudokansasii]
MAAAPGNKTVAPAVNMFNKLSEFDSTLFDTKSPWEQA